MFIRNENAFLRGLIVYDHDVFLESPEKCETLSSLRKHKVLLVLSVVCPVKLSDFQPI